MPQSSGSLSAINYGDFFRRALKIFIVASLVNFPWEVGQIVFYDFSGSFIDAALHCFIPSLGDGIILIIIYLAGLLVFRRLDWADMPGPKTYAVMLAAGFTVAIAVEWLGMVALGRWEYNSLMPTLPILNLGLLPILQMLLLPPLIFYLVARWTGKADKGRQQWQ